MPANPPVRVTVTLIGMSDTFASRLDRIRGDADRPPVFRQTVRPTCVQASWTA
jgi:hypothetical protein